MAASVLVAYASRYGSTQEVAEAVGATLREAGLDVDLRPIREVRTLEGYTAVVLGAPLYLLRWRRDAKRFLRRHRRALMQRQVAVFALGPFHNEDKEWEDVREQLDGELARFSWFQPGAVEVFGGAFDPKKLRFPWSLLPAMRKMPASDIRDWERIRTWADSFGAEVRRA